MLALLAALPPGQIDLGVRKVGLSHARRAVARHVSPEHAPVRQEEEAVYVKQGSLYSKAIDSFIGRDKLVICRHVLDFGGHIDGALGGDKQGFRKPAPWPAHDDRMEQVVKLDHGRGVGGLVKGLRTLHFRLLFLLDENKF